MASGQLTEGRLVAQAAALPDGRVVVTGGLPLRMTSYRPLDSVEVWDPATGLWTEVAPLKEGRAWGTLLRVGVLTSALVVLAGGAIYLVRHADESTDYRAFKADRLPDLIRLSEDIKSGQDSPPARGRQKRREHVDGGRVERDVLGDD